MNGRKDILGMYVGENESDKFWLSIMNGLKNRGVDDILIACVDGLTGFPQAIDAVYPETYKSWHDNWGQIHSQLEIYFEERLEKHSL